jgi:MFS transporter, DHA1 family, inner membrane transport protein
VTAVTMLGQYAVFTYVAPLITDVVGLDAASVGPLLFVYGVAGAVGLAIAGSPLARRPVHAMVGAMAVAAVALCVLGGAPGVWPSIIAFAVWGLAFGAIPPLLQTRLLQTAPSGHRDAASALYATAFNAGIGGGALVGALLFDRLGMQVLPFVYAALLVAVALTLVLSRGMFGAGRRAQPASTKMATAVGPVRSPAL